MRHIVYKVFVNFEKEESWLNKMSAQGFALEHYFLGRYTFQRCKPGEHIYRLELLPNWLSHPESVAYLEFMEDAGVEMVASWGRWVYFRKKAVDGPFELFSDKNSRIAHYKRILTMFVPIALMNLIFGMRVVHGGNSYNLLNIGAFLILAFPTWISYRRLSYLKKENRIRE